MRTADSAWRCDYYCVCSWITWLVYSLILMMQWYGWNSGGACLIIIVLTVMSLRREMLLPPALPAMPCRHHPVALIRPVDRMGSPDAACCAFPAWFTFSAHWPSFVAGGAFALLRTQPTTLPATFFFAAIEQFSIPTFTGGTTRFITNAHTLARHVTPRVNRRLLAHSCLLERATLLPNYSTTVAL